MGSVSSTSGGGACGPIAVARAVANGASAQQSTAPPVEDTIEKLQAKQTTCSKAIEVLELKIAKREEFLRKNGKTPAMKQKCLQMLREKKLLETDLKIQTANLDKFTIALAALSRNVDAAETVEALAEANNALRAVQADPVLQEADAVSLALEQALEQSVDLDQTLATPLKGAYAVDETDLDQELAAYDAADSAAEADQAAPPPVKTRPSAVPVGPVPQPVMSSPHVAPAAASAMYSNAPAPKQPPASTAASRMKELEQAVSV